MTTYHYYPSPTRQIHIRSSIPTFDRMSTTRPRSSVSPPGLSRRRSPSPEYSAPATPVFQSSSLHTSKMASSKPQVGFASPVATSAYRIPEWDERSVMRAFAAHASHCDTCCDPERALRLGQTLCQRGTELAKDLGKYFYCFEGKPFSTIDRSRRQARVQVEVPAEYDVVKSLFEALARGLGFASLKSRRPEVHQTRTSPLPRPATTSEAYEVKPSTSSRLHRSNTYTGYAPTHDDVDAYNYETRTPFDSRYRATTEEKPRVDNKRGSLYVPQDRRSKRKTYIVPISAGWLR